MFFGFPSGIIRLNWNDTEKPLRKDDTHKSRSVNNCLIVLSGLAFDTPTPTADESQGQPSSIIISIMFISNSIIISSSSSSSIYFIIIIIIIINIIIIIITTIIIIIIVIVSLLRNIQGV